VGASTFATDDMAGFKYFVTLKAQFELNDSMARLTDFRLGALQLVETVLLVRKKSLSLHVEFRAVSGLLPTC
jgi:hypothetical protein